MKIYSIHASADNSNLIEIETVILNGLYKFSILGINQKNSAEIKDRVYSALRSQKVLNLKSDNKKITVNLLPTNIEKKSNLYDLGIALSCMIHTNQIEMHEDALVVGELSITGNTVPSSNIFKTIYLAIKHDIKTIICSAEDLKILNEYKGNLLEVIQNHSIKFIAGHTLREIVSNIANVNYFNFVPAEKISSGVASTLEFEIKDLNIFKIVLAICTNRNVFIENKKDSYIKRFLKNLIYYSGPLSPKDLLYLSSHLHVIDAELLKKYEYPIISSVDSQTTKDDLRIILCESIFGFIIIEDFISIPEEIFYLTKKFHISSLLCFYGPCPCGNINNLFTSFTDEKCLCLQRNILRYRQKIKKQENGFFDFYINEVSEVKANFTAADYIAISNILQIFKNTATYAFSQQEKVEIKMAYENRYDKQEIDRIIEIAADVTKLKNILYKTKSTLSVDSVDFAIELIKKDF